MTTQKYPDVKHVIELKRDTSGRCEECRTSVDGQDLTKAINHYLAHDYVLLHVGSETERSSDGDAWIHSTIAILGKRAASNSIT